MRRRTLNTRKMRGVFAVLLLFFALIVPLLNAPTVQASTTVSFYSGAGDGTVYDKNDNWNVVHGSNTGTATDTATFERGGTRTSGTKDYIYRIFVPFDTSALPEGVTITSATLNITLNSKTNTDQDAQDYLVAVQTTQITPTEVVSADFPRCGSVHSPVEVSDRIDYPNLNVGSANTFTLNAAGLVAINTAGYTLLGFREGHDMEDESISGGADNSIFVRMSEYAGTSSDPILEITYYMAIVGDIEAPANVASDTYFFVNMSIQDITSANSIENATLELENGIILLWDNATDTFSILSDTNSWCTLGTGSISTLVNSTSYDLSWNISLAIGFPNGYVDVDGNVTTIEAEVSESEENLFLFARASTAPTVENAFISNLDDGSFLYTDSKYYTLTGNYSDVNGYGNITLAKIAFTDGTTWVNATYNATAGSWSLDSGTDYVILDDGTAVGDVDLLLVTFPMFVTGDIVNAINVSLYLYAEDSLGLTPGWNETEPDYFHISAGGEGAIETSFDGDAFLIAGGTIFDIAAKNSTEDSFGRVNNYVVNFQHLNTRVHLGQNATWDGTPGYWDCPSEHTDTMTLEYGVNYYFNGSWLDGWGVELSIIGGAAGTFGAGQDAAWVIINAGWYMNGVFVKNDTFVAMYEAYEANDASKWVSLSVDLWISKSGGSTRAKGRVAATYYGMNQTGWWLWADWGPVYGTVVESVFEAYLVDGSDNVVSASSLSLFRVWTKLSKIAKGTGTDCDTHQFTTRHQVGPNIRTLPSTETLVGIGVLTVQQTSTPNMPLAYFPNLANGIIDVLNKIYFALVAGATYIYGLGTGAVDSAFLTAFGIESITTLINSMATGFGSFVSDSVGYAVSLVTMIFGIFTGFALFIIEWLGRVASLILQISTIVQGILDGTYAITTGMGNIWDLIDLTEWVDVIPLFMLLAWITSIDGRARKLGGQWMGIAYGDISMIMAITSYIFDMSMRVISLIVDWASRLTRIIFPWLS